MRLTIPSLLACIALFGLAGCGPDDSGAGTGSMSTGLLIPQALSDELASVEIYIFEIDGDARPTKEELLKADALGSYDAYKDYKEFKKVTIAYQTSDQASISGIPDRGNVWRFYARGYDASPLLIAHGTPLGAARVLADTDEPTEILITLVEIP